MRRFRKVSLPEALVDFILVMPFLFSLLIDLIGLPQMVKYTLDVAWICLLMCLLVMKKARTKHQVGKLLSITFAFFALSLVGFLLHYQSFLFYFWGLRNNLRFFVYFFACVFFLRTSGVKRAFKLLDMAFWVNAVVVMYQYLVMNRTGDYLGGIFGVERGCNGYLNIFLLIIVTKSLVMCFNGRENNLMCVLKCALVLLISALAELKVMFFELAIILVISMKITKFTWKKVIIAILALLGILVGMELVALLFPAFANWFNLQSIWESLTTDRGYTSSNDMNRLTVLPIAMERFLPTIWEKLFGLGLGNCDYASFDFLVTPFYQAYSSLNYTWFSSAILVLETGIIGLCLYVLFFVMVYFAVNKRMGATDTVYCQISKILAVMCAVLVIYNASLRTEAAYMMYFVLAAPFAVTVKTKEKKNSKKKMRIIA